jgi:hypothetical protein
MAVTSVGGAIRALIVADGLVSGRCWQDDAPLGATLPYVTIDDAISASPILKGDGQTVAIVRLGTVHLWESLRAEDPALARRLWVCLDGKRVALDGVITRLAVDDSQRLPEPDNNNAHRALTLSIRHDPAAY